MNKFLISDLELTLRVLPCLEDWEREMDDSEADLSVVVECF
jgi:hypothetical protein